MEGSCERVFGTISGRGDSCEHIRSFRQERVRWPDSNIPSTCEAAGRVESTKYVSTDATACSMFSGWINSNSKLDKIY